MALDTLSKERIHNVWRGMKDRCYNPNSVAYKNYGGRGITICDDWKSFLGFREWALSCDEYNDTLTIERLDCDGNYEPNNCTWVTRSEQNKNRRCNHYVEYDGKIYNLSELAKLLHFGRTNFRSLEKMYGNSQQAINHILAKRKKEN